MRIFLTPKLLKTASAATVPAHAFAARTAYNRRNGESTAHMAIHGR